MAETFCIKQHKLTIATMPYEATALQLSEVSREGFRSDVELPGYNLVAGGQAQPGSALPKTLKIFSSPVRLGLYRVMVPVSIQ